MPVIFPTLGNVSGLPPAIQKLLSGPQFGALKDLVSGLTTSGSPAAEASPQSPTDELEAALNITGGLSLDLQNKHKVSRIPVTSSKKRLWIYGPT